MFWPTDLSHPELGHGLPNYPPNFPLKLKAGNISVPNAKVRDTSSYGCRGRCAFQCPALIASTLRPAITALWDIFHVLTFC